ncbi:hypothetical protein BDV18DRAFT_137940 [Aspergillus unguis]
MRGNPTPSPGMNDADKGRPKSPDSDICDFINDDDADNLLSKYRAQKQPHFPFVIIPPRTDIATLREESPFLLLCILTASLEHNKSLQETLEVTIRKEIANRVIVSVERNMDILQGLLVHAAWYHYHYKTYHTQIYMLIQMAMMVVADLGLDRQENSGFRMQPIPVEAGAGIKEPQPGSAGHTACGMRDPSAQSAAGQRALLGCYYLCSNSSLFRRQLYMRKTSWIDRCAQALAKRNESPTDSKLTTYVEVQSLMRRSQMLFDEERRCPYSYNSTSGLWDRASELMTQWELMSGLLSSPDIQDNWPLRIELGGAPALILGQALSEQENVFKLQELGLLEAMTSSAHYVLDAFLAAPLSVAYHLPTSSYGKLWYCLLMLSKLNIVFHVNKLSAVGVDKKRIHDKGVAIIQKFTDLAVDKNDIWTSSRKVIANMLAWLDKSMSNVESQSASTTDPTGESEPVPESEEQEPKPDSADQPDWLTTSYSSQDVMDFQFSLDDIDGGLWQQMLDSFTWFGPVPGDDGLGLDPYQE